MSTATEAKKASPLAMKLAKVMEAIERIPKNGRNEFHRYNYAMEADILAAVRQEMAQRNLIMVPDVVKSEFHELQRKNGVERLATLTVKFTVTDGESGEQMEFHALGEGTDAGDKATYKAMTGALKYALLKLFLIPTGDDPERDERPAPQPQRQQQRPPARQPVAAVPAQAPNATQGSGEATLDAAFKARARRIYDMATKELLGGDAKRFGLWVGEHLGTSKPSAQWTVEDMERLEFAIRSEMRAQSEQPRGSGSAPAGHGIAANGLG